MKRELLRFAIAGAIGFAVDSGLLYGMLAIGAGYLGGRAVSFLTAVWATWQMNRRFTFVKDSNKSAWTEWWHYFFVMLAGGVINYTAYTAAILLLPKNALLPLIAVGIGGIAGMTVNFVSAKLWVFKEQRNASPNPSFDEHTHQSHVREG
ncbi:GtrA family protein [Paraburkholderia phymatum]|uniref:GtrA family protein n=1 Tax=Paraburkholderia phymatum TaxID=148447 RepID=UPI003175BA7C